MDKNSQIIKAPFSSIFDNPSINDFLSINDDDPDIIKYKEFYQRIIEKNQADINAIVKLEEIIIQIRCKKNLAQNYFKLSEVRGYIYARSPFYRSKKNIKDIRVVVGKTKDFGNDLNELINNSFFLTLAKTKLKDAMTNEIISNMKYVEAIEQKYLNEFEKK